MMRVWGSLVSVSAALMCAAVLARVHCELPDTQMTQHGDFVQFGSAPDRVISSTSVNVRYNCSTACRIGVEIVISTSTNTKVIVFRRTWTNLKRFGKPRSRKVPLVFPPSVVYRRDFFVRRPVGTRDVTLRAWLVHLNQEEISGKQVGGYNQSLIRTSKPLRTLPPSERPAQPWTRSVSWGAWLMWQITKDAVQKCPHESDTVDLLSFPFASTGERFGIIHTFLPFKNRDLERRRVLSLKQPSVCLSVWFYLLSWCGQSLCGIVKHVNEHRKYGTPLIMLSDTGEVVLQVRMVSGEERAFTAHTLLPLDTWIRLDIFIQVSEVNLTITKGTDTGNTVVVRHIYDFRQSIQYNDTSGYFVIGGCSYMPGIHGYFGPVRSYRLGTEKVVNPLSPVRTLKELDRVHRHCEEMRQVTADYLQALKQNRDASRDVCESRYVDLRRMFGHRECVQTWSWEQQRKFNITLKVLEDNEDFITGSQNSSGRLLHLSGMIFRDVVQAVSKAMQSDRRQEIMSTYLELLQMSSCLGHHQSSLLLATLHLAGLGVPVDLEKGHVYSLVGGVADDRLALLHLGYKHMQGLDGFPKDQNTAYGYYSNIGRQTSIDRDQFHHSEQTLTEHVHLNNDEELQTQMGELGDIIQYVKHQAERGDLESQKSLAKMLLWGSNGVDKDVRAAVMWYARTALQMTDPTAMYDYAILLLKGTGVKKNRTLGLELLEKAADMGSVEAVNGLGWYYSTIVKDKKKAFRYFELAARNSSHDGLFNVGVYHLNGDNPDKPEINETGAFHYFLRAAQLGHVEGAVESASFLSTGTIKGVKRAQEKAVLLLKRVSERNGHLGFTVKEALQTYQRGSWDEALVKYAMLAETGLGVAQHNAAHLCEVLNHSSACHWRYYNYSTYNHIPQEAGLLRMGDYYCDLADMKKAMTMYSTAAVHGSPQGIFNLALLIEEGYEVPQYILDQMSISAVERVNRSVVVEKLLLRCLEFEEEEGGATPCSLVLWRIQLMRAWRGFTHSSVQLPLAGGTVATLTVFVITLLIRTLLVCYSATSLSANQSSEREHDPSRHDEESSRLNASAQQEQRNRHGLAHHGHLLHETADLVITVTGVCACVILTMFISHLL